MAAYIIAEIEIIAILATFLFAGATTLAADNLSRSEMVAIPAGAFLMGSSDGANDDRPSHQVSVAAFEIDRLPVTNARFAEFLNAVGAHSKNGERLFDDDDPNARIHIQGTRCVADKGFENHPVVEVSWPGARDYCAWHGKRLSTEAESEKKDTQFASKARATSTSHDRRPPLGSFRFRVEVGLPPSMRIRIWQISMSNSTGRTAPSFQQ